MRLTDIWVFTVYQALFACFTCINSINPPNIPTRQNLYYFQFTKGDIWDKDRELVQWLHRNREPWYQSILESSVQFSLSVVSDSLRPHELQHAGLPVQHQLPEPTQTHVHWVSDAIQPSHHLSSPYPPSLNLSQHQGLFKWVSSSHQVAKVLEFQLQHQSFQWIFRTDFL